MKLIRFFANLLLFLVSAIVVSMIQVGTYDLISLQSSAVEPIHVVAQKEDDVAYLDTYTFWAEDIGTGVKTESKYRIRNWFGWDWWKNGMGWADTALDVTIAAVKPIVVPVAQMNAVREYYRLPGDPMYSESQKADILGKFESKEDLVNDALYELYFVYGKGFSKDSIALTKIDGVTPLTEAYKEEYDSHADLRAAFYGNERRADYNHWVDEKGNKVLWNHQWKLKKYNCGEYDKYFKKFIHNADTIDARTIKTPAVMLYYQQYVALIVALIFVIKYPINLFRMDVESGPNTKRRLFGRQPRKEKK